jgi:hypothetical protein
MYCLEGAPGCVEGEGAGCFLFLDARGTTDFVHHAEKQTDGAPSARRSLAA